MIFPRHSITPDLLPTIGTGLNTCDTIKDRPNIETEHGVTVRESRSGIVVDDVSDFIARLWTIDDPVVSVKWRLGAAQSEFEDQEMYEGWAEEKNWNLLEVRW